jgi:integrase
LRLHQAKTGESVSILLPVFVADVLRQVRPKNPKYSFSSGQGKLTSTVGLWHERLAEICKVAKVTNGHRHRFRDTFAVALLTVGTSLENVSTLLGHRNLKITHKHYSPGVKARQDALDLDIQNANKSASLLYKIGTEK